MNLLKSTEKQPNPSHVRLFITWLAGRLLTDTA